jgi:hypothetical protein
VTKMLIDFERQFSEYLDQYVHDHHIDEDSMENIVPDLYLDWLDMPQDWLRGASPNSYFASMDAVALIGTLGQYMLSDITLPGPLLNRIADNRGETYPLLVSLLKNYSGENEDKIRTVVVRLIEEMDMDHPYDYYIEVISQSGEQSDFSEACADELRDAGPAYLEPMIRAFEQAQTSYAMDCFLDILTDMPYDERTYGYAMERFLLSDTQKAFYANCLGKLGDPRALPALEEALRQENLKYFDYIAIRNALEELGGEVDIERDFAGDNDYESLIDLEKKH